MMERNVGQVLAQVEALLKGNGESMRSRYAPESYGNTNRNNPRGE
jgi:hypothetical protein